jgi:glycosyltransferase involved in cell wall biosynthesis
LADAVNAILSQDFHGSLEVVLAIGPSHDGTEEIAQALAQADTRVVIVANPSGRTAAGLNLAIAKSKYSIIVRVDGHSEIPQNYLSLVLEILTQSGAVNVGGVMAASGKSLFERAVARAMRSSLGVGASRFHTGGLAASVDTVYLGAFRKEALLAVGGFDERFTRAQDWELNFRLRAAGGIVYFDPRLVVTYRPRSSVSALARQYFEYGRWRRVVSRRHEGTINYRYLAPPFTVIASALSIILGSLLSTIFLIPVLIYALFILLASIMIGKSFGEVVALPLILLTMHMSWGTGFLTSPKSLAP